MKKIFSRNIEQLITRIAMSSYLDSTIIKEWKVAIIALGVIKVLTMAISIFAASMFVYNMAIQVVNWVWLAILSTGVILISIEVLNALFMDKMFKNLLKGRWAVGFGLSTVVGLVYLLSFYTSTNGLAERQAELVNQEVKISDDYASISKQIGKGYSQRIAEVDESIRTVKTNPQLWKQGARVDLSSEQLSQIQDYNRMKMTLLSEMKNELSKVEKAKRENLKENKENTDNEASKYWNIVASVMLIQLLVNFGLMFFWAKISDENKPEEVHKEEAEAFVSDLRQSTRELRDLILREEMQYYKSALTNISPSLALPQSDNLEATETEKTEPVISEQPAAESNRMTIQGFAKPKSTAADRPTTSEEIEEAELVEMAIPDNKKYIVKHIRQVFGRPVNNDIICAYGKNKLINEIIDLNPAYQKTSIKGVIDTMTVFDASKGGLK